MSFGLAALRSVKKDPDSKVLAEVFKTVLRTGGCEEEITGTKGLPCFITDKITLTLDHDVGFVTGMRLLRIGSSGSVYLNQKAAVLEDSREPFSFSGWQLGECLVNSEPAAGIFGHLLGCN